MRYDVHLFDIGSLMTDNNRTPMLDHSRQTKTVHCHHHRQMRLAERLDLPDNRLKNRFVPSTKQKNRHAPPQDQSKVILGEQYPALAYHAYGSNALIWLVMSVVIDCLAFTGAGEPETRETARERRGRRVETAMAAA